MCYPGGGLARGARAVVDRDEGGGPRRPGVGRKLVEAQGVASLAGRGDRPGTLGGVGVGTPVVLIGPTAPRVAHESHASCLQQTADAGAIDVAVDAAPRRHVDPQGTWADRAPRFDLRDGRRRVGRGTPGSHGSHRHEQGSQSGAGLRGLIPAATRPSWSIPRRCSLRRTVSQIGLVITSDTFWLPNPMNRTIPNI